MEKNSKWQYIFLGVSAFLVVIVVVCLHVAASFHIPLVSLLPSGFLIQRIPTPTPGVKSQFIQRLYMADGTVLYMIKGKFVTPPSYVNGLLHSDFVIDGDPHQNTIPVYMPKEDGKINVGKASDASFGKIVWTLTPTEELQKAISPGAPALLQIEYFENQEDPARAIFQPVLDRMIQGTWDLSKNFVFSPTGVAVVQ